MPKNAPIRHRFESTLNVPLQPLWAFYMSGWRHRVSRREVRDLAGEVGGRRSAATRIAPAGGER